MQISPMCSPLLSAQVLPRDRSSAKNDRAYIDELVYYHGDVSMILTAKGEK